MGKRTRLGTGLTAGLTIDIVQTAVANQAFRRDIATLEGGQIVAMHLQPGQDIGLEVHDDVDQLVWSAQGTARAILDGQESTFGGSDLLIIPRGTQHNIVNTSKTEPLKILVAYMPPLHPVGVLHQTKRDAEVAEAGHRGRA